jgi:hypothetical protein
LSSASDDERRWQALADEARAMLERMADPEARRFMRHVMMGYMSLAQHARRRQLRGQLNDDDV